MDDYVFKRYPMYDRVYICIFVYTFGGVFKKFSMQEFSRDIGVLSFSRAFGRISNLYSDSRI